MPSLMFCVPAHGRLPLARICLRQLRYTCDQLAENGVHASAIVVADDANLDTAREFGFGTVERDNQFVSRRFNDALQVACDPDLNPRPADFVCPVGSDDFVHPLLFAQLPPPDRMFAFQSMCFVREDGQAMTVMHLRNEGGCGIRIYPRQVMAKVGYRPADEDRKRGCDTSILLNLKEAGALAGIDHRVIDPRFIVDWKTEGQQLNPFSAVAAIHRGGIPTDPFETLAGVYPFEALDDMRQLYEGRALVVA